MRKAEPSSDGCAEQERTAFELPWSMIEVIEPERLSPTMAKRRRRDAATDKEKETFYIAVCRARSCD